MHRQCLNNKAGVSTVSWEFFTGVQICMKDEEVEYLYCLDNQIMPQIIIIGKRKLRFFSMPTRMGSYDRYKCS